MAIILFGWDTLENGVKFAFNVHYQGCYQHRYRVKAGIHKAGTNAGTIEADAKADTDAGTEAVTKAGTSLWSMRNGINSPLLGHFEKWVQADT